MSVTEKVIATGTLFEVILQIANQFDEAAPGTFSKISGIPDERVFDVKKSVGNCVRGRYPDAIVVSENPGPILFRRKEWPEGSVYRMLITSDEIVPDVDHEDILKHAQQCVTECIKKPGVVTGAEFTVPGSAKLCSATVKTMLEMYHPGSMVKRSPSGHLLVRFPEWPPDTASKAMFSDEPGSLDLKKYETPEQIMTDVAK